MSTCLLGSLSLCWLTDVLRDATDIKEIAMCAFLDIEGAFVITSHAECRNFQGSQEHSGLLDHISIVMNIIGSCPQGGV